MQTRLSLFQKAKRFALSTAFAARGLVTPVAFGATAIVQNAQDQVLLVRHSYLRGWHLPGGGIHAGEPPFDAVLRELREEVGLQHYAACTLEGLYTRRFGWATNVIALFHVTGAEIEFKKNLEVRDAIFCDPQAPPEGTVPGALRRLAELRGEAPRSPYW